MSDELPDLTGEDLIRYLRKDGWTVKRRAKHGVLVMKVFAD